ncbi:glycosyltransferase [Rheinheimera tangshanensis]|uniref:Glycosyltransferase family 4 protein n=1 Tax=Rheinheimera tangshanensis TaxID=400153 RepID=A0A5C8LXS8_9GAMM|nr:glycosyltransferase [Rheinheimera tangshanensis]TXK80499.1 glycosyltransferase family 4 protein [Rheinheimera tangshanensis]GGM60811.1 glycosyl transferase [Rheinheimera tangshanensis]
MAKRKVVLFYAHVDKVSLIKDISFYEQDVRALEDMGFEVCITNKYRDFFFTKYDFCYVWWWSYSLFPIIWSRLTQRKVVVAGAFHYSTPLMQGTDFVRNSVLYKFLVKSALKLAHANIFVSNYEFRDVVTNLSVNNPFVVHHGIDIDKYHPDGIRPETNSTINITIISWLETYNIERKCIREAVQAFNEVSKLGYPIILNIAGRPGTGYQEFVDFVSSLEYGNNVRILGHIKEECKISLLQNTDIFLSPTRYEGFGVAIAEALACGCAVLTSDNGATSEVAGDCAIYADPLSVDDITRKLTELVENNEKRRLLGERASKRIKEYFSYERHSDALKSVISKFFI